MHKIFVAVIASAVVVAMLSAFGTLTAFANPSGQGCALTSTCNPNTLQGQTGQKAGPANTCPPGNAGPPPGNAFNAGGSPFNPSGTAGGVYAGNPNTASLSHSNSGATVAQYDEACIH